MTEFLTWTTGTEHTSGALTALGFVIIVIAGILIRPNR